MALYRSNRRPGSYPSYNNRSARAGTGPVGTHYMLSPMPTSNNAAANLRARAINWDKGYLDGIVYGPAAKELASEASSMLAKAQSDSVLFEANAILWDSAMAAHEASYKAWLERMAVMDRESAELKALSAAHTAATDRAIRATTTAESDRARAEMADIRAAIHNLTNRNEK